MGASDGDAGWEAEVGRSIVEGRRLVQEASGEPRSLDARGEARGRELAVHLQGGSIAIGRWRVEERDRANGRNIFLTWLVTLSRLSLCEIGKAMS